jgi:hypothetical protein
MQNILFRLLSLSALRENQTPAMHWMLAIMHPTTGMLFNSKSLPYTYSLSLIAKYYARLCVSPVNSKVYAKMVSIA